VSLFDKRRSREERSGAGSAGDEDASRPGAGTPGTRSAAGSAAGSPGRPMAALGSSIAFKGDLGGDEDLRIDGRIEGAVQLPQHELTIGESGRVQAQIFARSVVVHGRVTGNVTATERVELQATGAVDGDIRAPRLVVAEGAVVNGAIVMSEAEPAAAPEDDGPGL